MLRRFKPTTIGAFKMALMGMLMGLVPVLAHGAQEGNKELVAVMDFNLMGAQQTQAVVLTNQFREELQKTNLFAMVDRNQLDTILKEQALQSSGCTDQKCAVQVGQVLGVKKIITGTVTMVTETLWQVNVQMVDVETGQTLATTNLNQKGAFENLLFEGMETLSSKLIQSLKANQGKGKAPTVVAEAPKAAPKETTTVPSVKTEPAHPQGESTGDWKWITSLSVGLVTGALTLSAAGDYKKSIDTMNQNITLANNATNTTDRQTYTANAKNAYSKAQSSQQSETTMGLISLVSLGLAGWWYVSSPSDSVTVLPVSTADSVAIIVQGRF